MQRNGNNKQSKQPKNKKAKRTQPGPSRSTGGRPQGAKQLSLPGRKWRNLLLDPCAAELASPCYTGTDGGYLIRTTHNLNPTITAGSSSGDLFISYAPWNWCTTTGYHIATGPAGSSFTPNNFGSNYIGADFIVSATVREYRPVACCLKWVPTGAIGTRSGQISLGYSAGTLFPVTGTIPTTTTAAIRSAAQRNAGNGSEPHEVNWVPTIVDEIFTSTASGAQPGTGCVFIGLSGVDVNSSTGSFNGYFETTTVWEWTPSTTSNIGVPLRSPPSDTSQQVLSTFGNIRDLVLHSVQKGAEMAGGMAGGAFMNYANGFLRNGRPNNYDRITY